MTAQASRVVAWGLLALSVALAITGAWLFVVGPPAPLRLDYDVPFFVAFLVFSVVGAVVASRVPSNPIGWLLLVQGVTWELAGVMAGYANNALNATDGSLPGGPVAAWAVNWLYIPALGAFALLLLLFPDGRLPSRRWRPVAGLIVLGMGLAFADSLLAPGPLQEVPSVANPFGVQDAESVLRIVGAAGDVVFTAAGAGAVLSLVFRYRRSRGVERQQLKWLAVAGCVVLVAGLTSDVLEAVGLERLAENVFAPSLLAVPVAVGIAVLRFRLYDIDIVISKTVIFGGLVVFIGSVYLTVVVGIGAVLGRTLGSNLTLAVVATALVAVAFQPARARLHRAARRLVFGPPTAPEEKAGVAIHCLGAFRVFRDGELLPLSAWQSKKARTLLKILVARRGRATHREHLMDILWPEEDPAVVTRRLSVALATVRAVLDPGKVHPPDHFLVGTTDAVRIDLVHLPVDVERFITAATESLSLVDRVDTKAARALLTTAADAYTGDFMEEDLYEDWAGPLREEARTTYVSVLRALAGLAERSGAVADAVRDHLRILEVDPWNEGAHIGLVRVMEGAGRHGEARRYFEVYATRMEEIGLPAQPFPPTTHA